MKILFVIDTLARGGKERRMIELLKGLLETEGAFLPEVLVLSDRIEYNDVFELGIPIHRMPRSNKKDPSLFRKFYHLCRQIEPQLIHCWSSMSTIYATPTARWMGIRLINGNVADAPLHLTYADKRYFWARLSFLFSDAIIGNSEAGLQAYQAPAQKSRCIYNGFDFQRLKQPAPAEETRRRLGLLPGQVVGMVGAFYDRKDYATFIKAAQLLLADGLPVNFLAIGEGPNRPACAALLSAEETKRILLPGLIKDIESVIQLFDIGVLATNSTVHGEGISNAILEYMALAKPVVATRGGGTPEIVVDQETGFLVPPNDPAVLAGRIRHLLDNPSLAVSMGNKGRQRVEGHFSLPRMKQEYIRLYHELTEKAVIF